MLHGRPQEDRNRETLQRGLKSLREYTTATLTLAEVRNYEIGAVAIQADVSKVDTVERLFTQTLGRLGILDIVVANAQLMGVQPEVSR